MKYGRALSEAVFDPAGKTDRAGYRTLYRYITENPVSFPAVAEMMQ